MGVCMSKSVFSLTIYIMFLLPLVSADVSENVLSNFKIAIGDNEPSYNDNILLKEIIQDFNEEEYGEIDVSLIKRFEEIDLADLNDSITLLIDDHDAIIILGETLESSSGLNMELRFTTDLATVLLKKNVTYNIISSSEIRNLGVYDLFATSGLQVCADSDNGNNPQIKGSVLAKEFWFDYSDGVGVYNEFVAESDSCVELSGPGINLEECSGDDCGVREYSCWNEQPARAKVGLFPCANGCMDGACLDSEDLIDQNQTCELIGLREDGRFCSTEKFWVEQNNDAELCENNFECSSNVCVSGQCVSSSLIDRILDWFRRILSIS